MQHLKRSTKILLATTILFAIITVAFATALITRQFSNTGFIVLTRDITLWKDNLFTQPLTTQDWGNLAQGSNTLFQFWIKSTGEANVFVKWQTNPASITDITLEVFKIETSVWLQSEAYEMPVGSSLKVKVYLHVSATAQELAFAFNFIVGGFKSSSDTW